MLHVFLDVFQRQISHPMKSYCVKSEAWMWSLLRYLTRMSVWSTVLKATLTVKSLLRSPQSIPIRRLLIFFIIFFNLGNNLSSGPFVLKMIPHNSSMVLSSLCKIWDGSYLALEILSSDILVNWFLTLAQHRKRCYFSLSGEIRACVHLSRLPLCLARQRIAHVLCSLALPAYHPALSIW